MLSNLLRQVRLSDEKFAIGPRKEREPEIKYIPESDYKLLLERSRQEKDKAYRTGFSDGQQAGLAKGMEEAKKVVDAFNRLMVSVQNQRAEIYRQAELELVELALTIAHKIISAKAEIDNEIVIDAARKAVRLLLDKSNLVMKIAPEQESFVRENMDKLLAIDDRIEKIEIESDRRVGVGGCILETESGNVDARIETELQNITDALRKANLDQSND